MKTTAKHIHIKGLVQGVGFRPFIFRLAGGLGLKGWVVNGTDGVRIHVEGDVDALKSFPVLIKENAPEASFIHQIISEDAELEGFTDFQIRQSQDDTGEITEISPDIAVCSECLNDMKRQPHRLNYPFINCTNCGPRFSIIRDLPYDRSQTTMAPFAMCDECRHEYTSITDRRFHAQPVACTRCGPRYELLYAGERTADINRIIPALVHMIAEGKIIAMKGLGGFHLACDALNENAVRTLRSRKNREGKPFAIMAGSIEGAKQFFETGEIEEKALLSWQRPIVILKNRKDAKKMAPAVSNGFDTTGTMLPYMPFHHLLFEKLMTPAIVLTSGNISDEPIIIDNKEAEKQLSSIADAFLLYNRDIFNRTDDSVVMAAGGEARLIRRSRGFAPAPLNLPFKTEGIFAAGSELVNCFCLGRGSHAFMSQHIGDLKNLETLEFYTESFDRFRSMFRVKPTLVACDLHPDYLSSRFAEDFALKEGLPLIKVQHHHAHIASCMAENGLDETVIGISMDGVGAGTDGHIWGFEVMTADLTDFTRISHLDYIPQPGGDQATLEPWRMAVSFINKYVGPINEIAPLPFADRIDPEKMRLVNIALRNNINCPLTSSAGRLFDAVAAMTGICLESAFHAEAPMRLENIIDDSIHESYEMVAGNVIDPSHMINCIYSDIRNGIPASVVSTKFHRALVNVVLKSAVQIRESTGLSGVALSGGVFQNRFLLSNVTEQLLLHGFKVYSQKLYPSNDGGIALGQLVIAARQREG